jgi:hypothetical protein
VVTWGWVQALRGKDLNDMFPVTDAEAPPTANPRGFANLLWKQLDHLGCVRRGLISALRFRRPSPVELMELFGD